MRNKVVDEKMLRVELNAANIAFFDEGQGEPILFIHGSWDDHHSWDGVIAELRDSYRVISYDRRGHSASTAPPGQGRLSEDVTDAAELLKALGLESAHIVGHSYGANVAIALAYTSPRTTRSIFVHEPPVFSLLTGTTELEALRTQAGSFMKKAAELLEHGNIEQGARLFIEKVAFGEGSWGNLFNEPARQMIISNAGTWLDQFRDPERLAVDVTKLREYPNNITFSTGTATLPAYRMVCQRIAAILPQADIATIEGGAHGAHISHSRAVAMAIRKHMLNTAS